MVYEFRTAPGTRRMDEVLLQDLHAQSGLTPLFGIAERDAMILERVLLERRVAAEKLQNIAALLACTEAYYQEFRRGEITRDALMAKVWETLEVLHHQTACTETDLLALS